MKQKVSSKKKTLIAASLLGIFLVGAIVSIVLVLAASTQNVASNITVSYNTEGVAAKVSANYAVVPLDTSATVTKTAMTTSGGGQEIVFNLSTNESTESISPTGDIILDPQNQKVVFEYVFESLADTSFSLELSQRPTGINMTETYYVSGRQLSAGEYRTRISKTTLAPQAITSLGQKVYVYIMASVTNENLTASYNGGFVWNMVAREAIDVTLNTDGATSTLKVIPNTITGLSNIAMPVLNTIPTKADYNFDGYYTEANRGGTQYINKYGASSHAADLAANTVLYAGWNQEVLDIEENVLYGLTNVGETSTTVEIPSNVTAIGDNAFANNTSIEVVAYEGAKIAAYADAEPVLRAIGTNAFANCTNLKEIYIPSTVTSFGATPLAGCTSLEKMEFPYILGDGTREINAFSQLFGSANTNIPTTLTEIIINSGTNIGRFAFYDCTNLTNILIPNSVTTIEAAAFEKCSLLESIVIPNSVNSIVASAFGHCSTLSSVVFEENSQLISLDYAVFAHDTSLTSIEIPEGVTSIGESAFHNCKSLAEVNIPETVNSIGPYAFFCCRNLSMISLPNGITTIGENAFYQCSAMTNINIPNEITTLEATVFTSCSALESITIPDNIRSIGLQCFQGCTSLSSVSFGSDSQLTTISDRAFFGCSALTSIEIPSNVEYIGTRAFRNCTKLTSVTFKNTANWVVSDTETFDTTTSLTSSNLANVSTAATYVVSTYKYSYWKRTA